MGKFTVPIEVADPQGRQYRIVEALVGSGAAYTVLPATVLERLGVVPHSTRGLVLAEGCRVKHGFGRTWIRINGHEEVSPVIFGDDGAQPLLGALTLEIFGLSIDSVNGRLMPMDALMLGTSAFQGRGPSDGELSSCRGSGMSFDPASIAAETRSSTLESRAQSTHVD